MDFLKRRDEFSGIKSYRICCLCMEGICVFFCVCFGLFASAHWSWKLLLSMIMIAVAIIGWTVNKKILYPLQQLQEMQKDDEEGEVLSEHIEIDAEKMNKLIKSENAVSKLILDIASSIHVETHAKALNAEIALYALQSEINPHFLYNSLEAIRNFGMNAGVTEISDMALALAKVFRYSISRPGEVATLEDEISNVKNYMKIQQYRFPGKFVLEFDIDESDTDIMKCKIPVLTLQPLVENAINHGLENQTRKGIITIRAYSSDVHLVLTVHDNGVGISEEKLEELREKVDADFVSLKNLPGRQLNKKTGVSLNNVNNRLKIYFGKDYGLSISSCEGEFTAIEIFVPKIIVT